MYASAQYISIISMIHNNMNKKINIPFSDFCSAGSSLQFVTTDLQTSHHNLSFRFLSLYSFNFLLYKGGLLSTSHSSFSMSSTIDSRMTQDTRLVHLTAASKQLFSCKCARTYWNMSVLSLSATFLLHRECVRPLQTATFLLPQQKSCQCARSRIKQCSPSGQLNSWATKVASARLA